MVDMVISGGQTGADFGGIYAANCVGIATGGYCAQGWRTEAGFSPWLAEYGLVEADKPGYPYRTRLNIEQSDGTLLLVTEPDSSGSKLTRELCSCDAGLGGLDRYGYPAGKPLFQIEWDDFGKPTNPRYTNEYLQAWVRRWLVTNRIAVLNVAGNRKSVSPNIEEWTVEFLTGVFL